MFNISCTEYYLLVSGIGVLINTRTWISLDEQENLQMKKHLSLGVLKVFMFKCKAKPTIFNFPWLKLSVLSDTFQVSYSLFQLTGLCNAKLRE